MKFLHRVLDRVRVYRWPVRELARAYQRGRNDEITFWRNRDGERERQHQADVAAAYARGYNAAYNDIRTSRIPVPPEALAIARAVESWKPR